MIVAGSLLSGWPLQVVCCRCRLRSRSSSAGAALTRAAVLSWNRVPWLQVA
jgi:hypothetical protein